MKSKITCLIALVFLLSFSAEAGLGGFLKGAAKAAMSVVVAPTITNIQYVGVSDAEWAEANGLTDEELEIYQVNREAWVSQVVAGLVSYRVEGTKAVLFSEPLDGIVKAYGKTVVSSAVAKEAIQRAAKSELDAKLGS